MTSFCDNLISFQSIKMDLEDQELLSFSNSQPLS